MQGKPTLKQISNELRHCEWTALEDGYVAVPDELFAQLMELLKAATKVAALERKLKAAKAKLGK